MANKACANPTHDKRADGRCRNCQNKLTREYKRRLGPEKRKEQHLRERYGITLEEFNRLFEEQGGLCFLCGHPPSGTNNKTKQLVVDHDHTTGRVRKLLCWRCNVSLGPFKDDPERLRRAADYIEAHRG